MLKRCLQRDVNKRASIQDLLEHPYINQRKREVKHVKKLDPADLLSQIQTLTPNTRQKFVENLTNTKMTAPPPPKFSED